MMANHELLEGEPFKALRGPAPEDQPECPEPISQNVDSTPQKKTSIFHRGFLRAKETTIDPKPNPMQVCKYHGKERWFHANDKTKSFVYYGWNVCGNSTVFCLLGGYPIKVEDVKTTAETFELEYKPKSNEDLTDCVVAKKKKVGGR
ncbi:hypothetical protein DdX_13214 [Ditylenchus destructor]|uniref:Uncharacterized protein n=1 Tax=Ditylenchus destructor TaxID=166010 RepID=A0AAD4MX11_9BILA|nr:hypothetical protein DdX_13214 [Ditylenchus destructor]